MRHIPDSVPDADAYEMAMILIVERCRVKGVEDVPIEVDDMEGAVLDPLRSSGVRSVGSVVEDEAGWAEGVKGIGDDERLDDVREYELSSFAIRLYNDHSRTCVCEGEQVSHSRLRKLAVRLTMTSVTKIAAASKLK